MWRERPHWAEQSQLHPGTKGVGSQANLETARVNIPEALHPEKQFFNATYLLKSFSVTKAPYCPVPGAETESRPRGQTGTKCTCTGQCQPKKRLEARPSQGWGSRGAVWG